MYVIYDEAERLGKKNSNKKSIGTVHTQKLAHWTKQKCSVLMNNFKTGFRTLNNKATYCVK